MYTPTLLYRHFVTLALWQLFEFIKSGKNRNLIIGFFAIGLAMLTKGPIGAAIPAFAVVGHIFFYKKLQIAKRLSLVPRDHSRTIYSKSGAYRISEPIWFGRYSILFLGKYGWAGLQVHMLMQLTIQFFISIT